MSSAPPTAWESGVCLLQAVRGTSSGRDEPPLHKTCPSNGRAEHPPQPTCCTFVYLGVTTHGLMRFRPGRSGEARSSQAAGCVVLQALPATEGAGAGNMRCAREPDTWIHAPPCSDFTLFPVTSLPHSSLGSYSPSSPGYALYTTLRRVIVRSK